MQLIILASGKGSRLKEKTSNKPKCLVKVNGKSIIDYMSELIKKKNTLIITGYKSNLLLKKFGNNKTFYNKDYLSTNMVHSLFSVYKKIRNDVIVIYSDIIFDIKIIDRLDKLNFTSMPVKKDWLIIWKKRMSFKKIGNDAEDLKIKKNKIVSIGNKIINNNYPKYQFMGIIKIKLNDYKKLYKFYNKINHKKIDFTSFLNLAIQENCLNIQAYPTSRFWIEIDNKKDLNVAKKLLNEKK
jgi:choline kinase